MSVVFPWISSPHGSLGLAHHRYTYCHWELSDANTQTLSGPLTLIRSLWCLEGQMVVVAVRAPGLTPLPIAGWLALGYEALIEMVALSRTATTTRTTCSPLSTPVLPTFSWRFNTTLSKNAFLENVFRQILPQVIKIVHDYIFILWQIKG